MIIEDREVVVLVDARCDVCRAVVGVGWLDAGTAKWLSADPAFIEHMPAYIDASRRQRQRGSRARAMWGGPGVYTVTAADSLPCWCRDHSRRFVDRGEVIAALDSYAGKRLSITAQRPRDTL